jgi:hypothetical protein
MLSRVPGHDRGSLAALGPFLAAVAVAVAAIHVGTAAEPLPNGDDTVATVPGAEVTRLANELATRAAAVPSLQGATLSATVDVDDDGQRWFVVKRVVDPARAGEQQAAMDELIRDVMPAGRFRIDDSDDFFPYNGLAAHLGNLIRTDDRFPGCAFLDGDLRFDLKSKDLKFRPRFKVAREKQFLALIGECRLYLGQRPETADVIVMDDDPGSQSELVAGPRDPDVNEVFRELQEATRRDVALHGAAIKVESDEKVPTIAPKGYVFWLTLDDARAAELSAAADSLARKLIPSGRFRFDAKARCTLPVSKLLEHIQREVDVDPRFAGCAVSHISLGYSSDASQIDVAIHGRVLRASQAEQIADMARRLMGRDPSWNAANAVLQTAGREDLAVTVPSPPLAASYYGQAMNYFYTSNYAEADKLLALASIEDPNNVVYRYWRVLGLMARGDTSAAEERLAKTIQGFGIRPQSQGHVAAMRAIYRIQGPLRLELVDMENRIMARGTRAVTAEY